MSTLKSLLDVECGTTNPLVQLSQIYKHVPQAGSNQCDQSIIAPHTFHLPSLLANFDRSDGLVNQWTNEFLQQSSEHVQSTSTTSVEPAGILWNSCAPPSSFFILRPNPLFLNQLDTGFDNDIVRATQNLLSFLQEKQYDIPSEKQTFAHEEKQQQQQPEKILQEINPFEQGLKCLEVHNISHAILYFQIAVRQQPDHTDAWLCLGMTQAENEQDAAAIIALKKCIELDSRNLLAHLTLASCHANELQKTEAFSSLYQWLANNRKYSQISFHRPPCVTRTDQLTFEDLKTFFFQAISLSDTSNPIDADLQVCLGILFYLNNDYTKAAECFQTAVLAKPYDALLWNKLGASIANGGENEKAVHAYHRALTLSPGYIRARYNLGLCCLNLKSYQQAVEHFLIALKLQTRMNMSENIWRTLASAIHHLNRSDLDRCVAVRDLSQLLHEFQIV